MNELPKYIQISKDIISTIRSGVLEAGDRAMSENEIIAHYNVSNTTARKALQEVERAGWVERIRGKGTVVLDNRVDRSVDRILGFTKNMIEAGRQPSTRLLNVQKRSTGRTLTIHGRHYHLDGPIYAIERLRLADGIPIMEEKRYISAGLCPDIESMPLEDSLFDLYENVFGLHLTDIHQVLSTFMIEDDRLMNLFELDNPTPAFFVEGVSFCGRDIILEMEESVYRGDSYHFTVTATR